MSAVEHTSHGTGHGRDAAPARHPDAAGLHPRRLVLRALLPDRPLPRRRASAGSPAGIRSTTGTSSSSSAASRSGPVGFLLGHRRLRLLALLGLRPPDDPGRPREPRRHTLEGLLQGQHRPQGDRRPVPRDDVRLLHARRPDGDALPRRARAAGHAVHGHADVQRPRLHARGADDLRLHHPRLRRSRELRRAADARRARTWRSRA